MADIDIASPGGNAASLKAALGSLGMTEFCDSFDVSSPVNSFILALPSGYQDFIFTGRNVATSSGSLLSFAFGDEGIGGSFYKDDETFLGYQIIRETLAVFTPDTDPIVSAGSFEDGYGYMMSFRAGEGAVGMFDAVIYPGSATSYAMCNSSGLSYKNATSQALIRNGSIFTTEQTRMDALRICHTSAEGFINSGSFALWGRRVGA